MSERITLNTHPGRWYEFRRGLPPPDSFDAARGEGYHDAWCECWEVLGSSHAVGFVTESEVKVFAADAIRRLLSPFTEQHRAEARKVSPRAFFEWMLTAMVAQVRVGGVEVSGSEFTATERVVGSIPASLTWDEVYPAEPQKKEASAA